MTAWTIKAYSKDSILELWHVETFDGWELELALIILREKYPHASIAPMAESVDAANLKFVA